MIDIQSVLAHYAIQGDILEISPFGGGHINDTFRVRTTVRKYLVQRINTEVFRNLEVMEINLQGLLSSNSGILVDHLRTSKGKYILVGADSAWKMQYLNQSTFAPSVADRIDIVREVAKGFGEFTFQNNGLQPDQFAETIPQFHHLHKRLEQLKDAVSSDPANRLLSCQELVDSVQAFEWINERMEALREILPKRVCHNDTKIDNILLSTHDSTFKYVIDLDTVGPGYVLYDFGDMLRTMLSPTTEGESDISKIHIREDFYYTIRSSFLDECGEILTKNEIDNLEFGGLYMTYIMGIRFLTDYLNGDVYYKVKTAQDNFVRARNQFRLLELLDEFVS